MLHQQIYHSLGAWSQGCQLLRSAWREEPKYEKNWHFNILQFFLSLRPLNCVSVLTLRKSDKKKKEKKKKRLCFSDAWDFTCLHGVRASEIVSRHETHAQWVIVDSPDEVQTGSVPNHAAPTYTTVIIGAGSINRILTSWQTMLHQPIYHSY